MTESNFSPGSDAYIQAAVARALATPAGVPLGYPMQAIADGLVIPSSAMPPTQPLDLVQVYLTAGDVLGVEPGIAWLVDKIDQLALRDVVAFATYWIARASSGAEHSDVDREFAKTHFTEPTRSTVLRLIAEGRRLVIPQALLVMIKIAVVRSGRLSNQKDVERLLPAIMLATLSGLGNDDNADPGGLVGEVIANQHFNNPGGEATRLAMYQGRWHDRDIADGAGPMADTYRLVTGLSLDALESVILTIWSHAKTNGQTFVTVDMFTRIKLPEADIQDSLDLISADASTLATMFADEDYFTTFNSVPWNFSPFERFPLLRIDGGWFVLNPEFLLNRLMAWPLVFDIEQRLKSTDRKEAARQVGRFRQATERYIQETITRTYALLPGRVFDEKALRIHLGRKEKVADVAIDYGHAWVVLEISTRRLMRESVYGGGKLTIDSEIDALVAKARQIDSSIRRIRETLFRDKGDTAAPKPIFFPVLLLTEGYPVNPIILDRLRHVLKLKSILVGRDTAPIELIDTEDLEFIEAAALSGGPSIVEVLTTKPNGGMRLAGVADHMRLALGLNPPRSSRARAATDRIFSRLLARVSNEGVENGE
jgi:hypothetical protein